jgi:hypothetical protein
MQRYLSLGNNPEPSAGGKVQGHRNFALFLVLDYSLACLKFGDTAELELSHLLGA